MAIRIEKNVPRPKNKPGAEEIVPELKAMEVGDSIFIPNVKGSGNPPVSGTAVVLYGIRSGRQHDVEYEDDGLRVWRTQ